MLREMKAEGIDYIPVDAELSGRKWGSGIKDGRKLLIGPYRNAVGIGPKTVQSIMSAKDRGEPIPEKAAKIKALDKDQKTMTSFFKQ